MFALIVFHSFHYKLISLPVNRNKSPIYDLCICRPHPSPSVPPSPRLGGIGTVYQTSPIGEGTEWRCTPCAFPHGEGGPPYGGG